MGPSWEQRNPSGFRRAHEQGMKALLKQMTNSFGSAVLRLMLKYEVKCEPTPTATYNYSLQGGKYRFKSATRAVECIRGQETQGDSTPPSTPPSSPPSSPPQSSDRDLPGLSRQSRGKDKVSEVVEGHGNSMGASSDYTALQERLSILSGTLPATTTRFLQPEELNNMLDLGLQPIPRSRAQAVWNIEDIPPSSLTAGWMAWYFGLTPDSSSVLDNATMKRLKLKLHPDSMQNFGRDALAFKSLFQVLAANTGSSAEFAVRLTLQRNAAATTLINNRVQQEFGEARQHREQLQEVCSDALELVKSQEVQIQALRGKLAEKGGSSAIVGELRRNIDTQTAKADAFKRKCEMSETDSRNVRRRLNDLARSVQELANSPIPAA